MLEKYSDHSSILKPPVNSRIYEGELVTFWFDEDGILYALAKSTTLSVQRQKENYAFVKQICNNKKVCLISDATSAGPQDKETRDYAAQELPNVFKAMAVISKSALGELIAKTFITLKNQPIPIKMFSNEKEAKEWIKQYL